MYKNFYLRSPDEASAQTDIENALESAGVNPSKVFDYEDGSIVGWDTSIISVFKAGEWPEQEAEYDSDGNQTQQRIDGDHCIITGRTDDPVLKDLIGQFEATDPKLSPSEVPVSNKQPNGTSRINPPATPIRPIATV